MWNYDFKNQRRDHRWFCVRIENGYGCLPRSPSCRFESFTNNLRIIFSLLLIVDNNFSFLRNETIDFNIRIRLEIFHSNEFSIVFDIKNGSPKYQIRFPLFLYAKRSFARISQDTVYVLLNRHYA